MSAPFPFRFVAAVALSLLVACSGPTPTAGCDATNCTGCCSPAGMCVAGTSTDACGAAGRACDVCASTQSCAASGACASNGGGSGGGGMQADAGSVFRRGEVRISHQRNSAGAFRLATATFTVAPIALPPIPPDILTSGQICSPATTMGACVLARCITPNLGDAGTTVGAGTLSVQAGSLTGPLMRVASGYGAYSNDGGVWWTGGEAVSVSATGEDGGAPAFTANVIAPSQLTLTVPASVVKGSTLPISWTGELDIKPMLIGADATGALVVTCTPATGQRNYVVPGEITQLFTGGVTLHMSASHSVTTTVGAWSIVTAAEVSEDRFWLF